MSDAENHEPEDEFLKVFDGLAARYAPGQNPIPIELAASLRWLAAALVESTPPPVATLRALRELAEELAPPKPAFDPMTTNLAVEFISASACPRCGAEMGEESPAEAAGADSAPGRSRRTSSPRGKARCRS
jgi:hypothetical protein